MRSEALFSWDRDRDVPVIRAPQPVARQTDPVTSHQAAALATPNAGTNRALALKTLREHPAGLTDFELAELTGLQQNSVGKRRGELRDAGLVEDSGDRRPSTTGSPAIVWRAVRRLVYCKACHKSHSVTPDEQPCAPGAWVEVWAS